MGHSNTEIDVVSILISSW